MALLTLKFVTDVRNDDYGVVEFHGELDQSTLENTEKRVGEILETFKSPNLIFDFTGLKFINSEGIGFIVSTQTKLLKRNQKLIICGLRRNVEDVLNLIGLPKLISIFPSVEETIKDLREK